MDNLVQTIAHLKEHAKCYVNVYRTIRKNQKKVWIKTILSKKTMKIPEKVIRLPGYVA
jgi:hypothetical protein